MTEEVKSAARRVICVAGVGGAGCSAVDRMAATWQEGPKIAVINTNAQALEASRAPTRIQIGARITKGFSSGGDPNVGRIAAEEDMEILKGLFTGVDLVFLVVGLGGGTGTGAAPAVARAAREEGAMVLAFATLPFDFEGDGRRGLAARGLAALRDEADAVIVVPNQRLFELVKSDAGAAAAFQRADEVLGAAIHSIWNLIVRRGLINLDFADLRNVVQNSGGTSVFGYGEGVGSDKAQAAVKAAMESPLLDHGQAVGGARALLVSILGGPELAIGEIELIMRTIGAAAQKNAQVIMGAATHPDWLNKVSVTIVASEQWNRPAGQDPVEREEEGGEQDPSGYKRKRRAKSTQTKLSLEPSGKGRFKDVEPTTIDGEDLDFPTYLRRGIVVDRGTTT